MINKKHPQGGFMKPEHPQITHSPSYPEHDEQILVVKRTALFPDGKAWHGLKSTGLHEFMTTVTQEKEFHPRSIMETDPRYKQIIPYLVFTHAGKYFLMQRTGQASEQRLKNKYSLGIGGHMRREDFLSSDIMDWAQREFREEIDYKGTHIVKPLGLLNDDSNPVGEVHIGCVLLLEGDSPDISVKSELRSGQLVTIEECQPYYDMMETWSKMVLDALKTL